MRSGLRHAQVCCPYANIARVCTGGADYYGCNVMHEVCMAQEICGVVIHMGLDLVDARLRIRHRYISDFSICCAPWFRLPCCPHVPGLCTHVLDARHGVAEAG